MDQKTMIELSRIRITGELKDTTPRCVFEEISLIMGMKFEKNNMSALIKSTEIYNVCNYEWPKIELPLTDENCPIVARFINPLENNWTKEKLKSALDFILLFMDDSQTCNSDPLGFLGDAFKIGLQTSTHIDNINLCILYRLCKIYNITVDANTTPEMMKISLKYFRTNKSDLLVKLDNILINLDKGDIIKIFAQYYNTKINSDSDEIKQNNLDKLYTQLADISFVRKKIQPKTKEECIALAAIEYSYDISRSNNPFEEFKLLSYYPQYNPKDAYLQKCVMIDRKIIKFGTYFNPIFPERFYTTGQLWDFCVAEGYSHNEIVSNSKYELLQIAHVSETFHSGIFPETINKTTIIELDDINFNNKEIYVSYGIRYEELTAFSLTELKDLFINNMNFFNPIIGKAPFSDISIEKLKYMCRKRTDDEKVNIMKKELLDAITSVNNYNEIILGKGLIFKRNYNDSNILFKDKIKTMITSLYHLSLYMRGWKGKTFEPISYVPISSPIEQEEIYKNVEDAFRLLMKNVKEAGMYGKMFLDLPLLGYKNGIYYCSNDVENGFTIKDRLEIIEKGYSSGISSCIRISSNWLASTAHRYMLLIGMEPPFDIKTLRDIQ